MRKITKIAILALGFMGVYSCFEDKGNYEYIELDEVTIDAELDGIQGTYALTKFDSLTIEPNVYFNGELVNGNESKFPLRYEWSIYNSMTGGNTPTEVTVLGDAIKFNNAIPVGEGQWTLRLVVQNTETLVKAYSLFSLQVSESLSDGILVYYESKDEPGTSDVGLIINAMVKKNYASTEKCFVDLYKNANGTHIAGEPIHIMHSASRSIFGADGGYKEVMMTTTKDFVGVGYASFERQLGVENLFWLVPESTENAYFTGHPGRGESVIIGNKPYHADYRIIGEEGTFFGVPYEGDYGTLAMWIPIMVHTNFDVITYDADNQRFLCAPYGSIKLGGFTPDMTQVTNPAEFTMPFDVNNVGMDMWYSDYGFHNYEYSIMHDNNTDSTWLFISNFATTNVSSPYIAVDKIDINSSPKVDEMTSMSCGGNGEILFYSAGNKVFLLKYITGRPATELFSFPSNEKVTCVRTHKFYYGSLESSAMMDPHKILHVATYDETTGDGKVYMFPIDPTSGAITGDYLEYSGFGKVKDMAWKYGLTI
ncbi:MAG: hypothetical protein J6K74_06950 [Marinifilaceae bacterium]|nr:hypothetical protein [Marinifilaceae bacterium]